MPDTLHYAHVVVVLSSLVAAFTDVWRFKVYNALSLPLLMGAFVYYGTTMGLESLLWSAGGCFSAFCMFLVPYAIGAVGAGDVKFVVALGAWIGTSAIAYVILFGCVFTGLYALAVIIYYRRLGETMTNLQISWHRFRCLGRYLWGADGHQSVQDMARLPDRRSRLVPISAMMAAAIVLYVFWNMR